MPVIAIFRENRLYFDVDNADLSNVNGNFRQFVSVYYKVLVYAAVSWREYAELPIKIERNSNVLGATICLKLLLSKTVMIKS